MSQLCNPKNEKRKKIKEKGKKKEKNLDPTVENSTFTISLERDSKSPFLLRREQNHNSHTPGLSPTADTAPWGGQRREKIDWQTPQRRKGAHLGPAEKHKPWEHVSDEKLPEIQCLITGAVSGFAMGTLSGLGKRTIKGWNGGGWEEKTMKP